MRKINVTQYPALQEIMWDDNATRITEQEAFHYYEDRWQYVEPNMLTAHETLLIVNLTKTIGHGHMLVG
jgi:hypothetical protein